MPALQKLGRRDAVWLKGFQGPRPWLIVLEGCWFFHGTGQSSAMQPGMVAADFPPLPSPQACAAEYTTITEC